MIRREDVTERMRELMSDADRQLFTQPLRDPPGQQCMTHHDDAGAEYFWNLEKQQHAKFEDWLNLRELFYDHQRMDKRTTNRKGIPDFIFGLEGLLICVEFKCQGRKLTPEQEEWRRRALENSKCQYYVFEWAGDAITFFRDSFESCA